MPHKTLENEEFAQGDIHHAEMSLKYQWNGSILKTMKESKSHGYLGKCSLKDEGSREIRVQIEIIFDKDRNIKSRKQKSFSYRKFGKSGATLRAQMYKQFVDSTKRLPTRAEEEKLFRDTIEHSNESICKLNNIFEFKDESKAVTARKSSKPIINLEQCVEEHREMKSCDAYLPSVKYEEMTCLKTPFSNLLKDRFWVETENIGPEKPSIECPSISQNYGTSNKIELLAPDCVIINSAIIYLDLNVLSKIEATCKFMRYFVLHNTNKYTLEHLKYVDTNQYAEEALKSWLMPNINNSLTSKLRLIQLVGNYLSVNRRMIDKAKYNCKIISLRNSALLILEKFSSEEVHYEDLMSIMNDVRSWRICV